MDILKPDLIWIENRCYRKLCLQSEEKTVSEEDEFHPSQSRDLIYENDDVKEIDHLPIKQEGNQYYVSMPVPGPLIGYVCGKDKKNIKMIQGHTGAQIKIPGKEQNPRHGYSSTEKSKDFVITSVKRHSVARAFERIERIMMDGRWKICDYTHFVSIPLNNSAIQDGVKKFHQEVKKFNSVRGIKDALFEIPAKLHLTIAMLILLDDREKENAKFVLNKCKSEIAKILDEKHLKVEVRGIEYMNDDPGEVDVLYGKVQESDKNNLLQLIAEKLLNAFVDVNFARKERENVKLHVTLMKSKSENEKRNSFDARPLLEKHGDFFFGEMDITQIHISTRFTGGVDGKYYTPLTTLTL